MRILILGGTGFIGAPLTRQLHRAGHTVTVFHRGETDADLPDTVRVLHGDRNHLSERRADVAAFEPSVVVDLIAYTEAQAEAGVSTFADLADRAVVLSSGDVYRNYDGLRGASAHAPDAAPLGEDAPLRANHYPYRDYATDDRERLYHYDKILVEEAYRAADALSATILRLPALYGPRDDQHRLFPYVKRMDDGRPAILLGERHADWRWTRGYVENVASAIALAATDARAAGRTYNLGAPDAPTEAEWVGRIADAADWNGEVVAVPNDALPDALQSTLDYRYDMALDTSRFREELGYSALVGAPEAMARAVAWARQHPPASSTDPFDYAAEDAVLEQHAEAR